MSRTKEAGNSSLPLNAILAAIGKDIEENPGKLIPLTERHARCLSRLTQGVDSDPEEELDGDVDLDVETIN